MPSAVTHIFSFGDKVERVGSWIYNWRSRNSDLSPDVRPVLALTPVLRHRRNLANILRGHGRAQVNPPQGSVGERIVGIEGVHTVVFCRNVNHIARPSLNVEIRDV